MDSSSNFTFGAQNLTAICPNSGNILLARIYLVLVTGTSVSLLGIVENSILFYLLLSRKKFRLTSIFFLAFVAMFDLLLDLSYLPCRSLEMLARWFGHTIFERVWVFLVKPFYTLSQVARTASTFCLILASFERYRSVGHWTFSGFEVNMRVYFLLIAILCALLTRVWVFWEINLVKIANSSQCQGDEGYRLEHERSALYYFGQEVVGVLVPFGCLIYLNYGIIAKLRRQRLLELRSMMLELAVGKAQIKQHKRRIRAATRTLVAIISAYLISNSLKVILTIWESVDSHSLKEENALFHRFSEDCTALMAMLGNVVRLPIYACLDPEIRSELKLMLNIKPPKSSCQTENFTPEQAFQQSGAAKIRRFSEVIERPIRVSQHELNGLGWCNNLLIQASFDDLARFREAPQREFVF